MVDVCETSQIGLRVTSSTKIHHLAIGLSLDNKLQTQKLPLKTTHHHGIYLTYRAGGTGWVVGSWPDHFSDWSWVKKKAHKNACSTDTHRPGTITLNKDTCIVALIETSIIAHHYSCSRSNEEVCLCGNEQIIINNDEQFITQPDQYWFCFCRPWHITRADHAPGYCLS